MKVGVLGFAHGHVNGYCSRWRDVLRLILAAYESNDTGRRITL